MNQYGWLPAQWLSMDSLEKALVIAGIDLRTEQEERERKRQEREARKGH